MKTEYKRMVIRDIEEIQEEAKKIIKKEDNTDMVILKMCEELEIETKYNQNGKNYLDFSLDFYE